MIANGLSWREWRDGGADLLLMRDLAPSVSEEILAAAWRAFDATETEQGRADVLELLCGCEAVAREEAKGCS